jgi:hypothetical protein
MPIPDFLLAAQESKVMAVAEVIFCSLLEHEMHCVPWAESTTSVVGRFGLVEIRTTIASFV